MPENIPEENNQKSLWITIAVIVVILLIIGGFYAASHRSSTSGTVATSTESASSSLSNSSLPASSPNVTESDVLSATYNVFNSTTEAKLVNGTYASSNPPIYSTMTHFVLADLDHNGTRDGLVSITTSRGDSTDELFEIQNVNGQVVTKALVIPVGTGNSVRNITSLSIDTNGLITMNLSVLAPNDPHCCASIQGQYHFTFDGKNLISA